VEDLLFERGIDICHETVRMWWNRFAPMLDSSKLSIRSDERAADIGQLKKAREWLGLGQSYRLVV
jgi:putative transposase